MCGRSEIRVTGREEGDMQRRRKRRKRKTNGKGAIHQSRGSRHSHCHPLEDGALVRGDHILDVDVSIRAAPLLQLGQGLLNDASNVSKSLMVVNAVS